MTESKDRRDSRREGRGKKDKRKRRVKGKKMTKETDLTEERRIERETIKKPEPPRDEERKVEEKETGKKRKENKPPNRSKFDRYDVSPTHSNCSKFITEPDAEEESKKETSRPGILVEIFTSVDIQKPESPKQCTRPD